jgi:hypothetical protein
MPSAFGGFRALNVISTWSPAQKRYSSLILSLRGGCGFIALSDPSVPSCHQFPLFGVVSLAFLYLSAISFLSPRDLSLFRPFLLHMHIHYLLSIVSTLLCMHAHILTIQTYTDLYTLQTYTALMCITYYSLHKLVLISMQFVNLFVAMGCGV